MIGCGQDASFSSLNVLKSPILFHVGRCLTSRLSKMMQNVICLILCFVRRTDLYRVYLGHLQLKVGTIHWINVSAAADSGPFDLDNSELGVGLTNKQTSTANHEKTH